MKLTKVERSWVLYDVANSAFTLMATATIPVYFREVLAKGLLEPSEISRWLYIGTSVSTVVLAFASPILGAIGDYQGMKKKLFISFLLLGLVGGLTFTVTSNYMAFMLLYIMSQIGYSACNMFYDSMLVDVSTDERMDAISGYGYAFGYVGSTIPFIIGVALLMLRDQLGLSLTLAMQLSFIVTFIWWGSWALPLIKNVHQTYYLPKQEHLITTVFGRIGRLLGKMKKDKRLFYFVLAYFLYIEGVYTIISSATTFGGEVGIDSTAMILALLLTQFVAFPFAILAGPLAKKFGSLNMIRFYILIYAFVCVLGYQLSTAAEFWTLAVIVGLAQGGIQSLSRSYFGQIIPKNESNEYFGFLDIFGKFANLVGPAILTISTLMFDTSRPGILFLIMFFVFGFILVSLVAKLDKQAKKA